MNKEDIQLKPCPFCGFQVDRYGLDDVLYPNGTFWRPHDEMERKYVGFRDQLPTDHACYNIICNKLMGGCGAEMHGDSVEEVVDKWNARV